MGGSNGIHFRHIIRDISAFFDVSKQSIQNKAKRKQNKYAYQLGRTWFRTHSVLMNRQFSNNFYFIIHQANVSYFNVPVKKIDNVFWFHNSTLICRETTNFGI